MKIQLTLLLVVVLLASLPSIVFAQPPRGAVQSGETSQTAKATDIVQKSWEGPFFGLGAGLGIGFLEARASGQTGRETRGLANVKIQLGYGLSDRTVLYGSVFNFRIAEGEGWLPPLGLFGAMWKWPDRESYGFAAIGTALSSDGESVFALRTGGGVELYPGLALEGATTGIAVSDEGLSGTIYSFALTFNYHWY